ncbi:MAG: hypothetical protein M0Q23_08400 [Syntrophales bacterium]|jgi:hypothetical protein|nr:hypothetical protein [Syntrophales bacterium]MCK9528641.1 hypothetical protein [Syntrophales bacterium]MDX9923082.1 hypothetical protein [Syntrophales bacterium]
MKRIYVLGSGSSIGHSHGSFPSIADFFPVARKLGLDDGARFEKIRSYAQGIYGEDIFKSKRKIDIETFLTHLEIEIERTTSPDYLLVRQQLHTLIQDILILLEDGLEDQESEYDYFVQQLHPSDTIITFNWDVVLDNSLGRAQLLGGNKKDSYDPAHYKNFVNKLSALSERTWAGAFPEPPYEEWTTAHGYYLKAHGSVDWLYCANETCRSFRKVYPALNPRKMKYCSSCHEPLVFLIVPPVLNKGYRQYPMIRRIWNFAAKEMTAVNELVVWGYSLPPTDFYVTWLLRQPREAPLEKLVIINPSVITRKKEGISLGLTFIRRFYDLFRDKVAKENVVLYENYPDYHSNTDVFQKHPLKEKDEAYKSL